MILCDEDIRRRLMDGSLVIEPLADLHWQLQPASLDLRLASEFVLYRLPEVACIDTRDQRSVEEATEIISVKQGDGFVLHPGEFVLGATIERVSLPPDLVAQVEGRSSIGRLAVVVHATAGFVDPGFRGRITLELSNLGRCAVRLYPGMRVSQLVFHSMTGPAQRPYGSRPGSKYQGQDGPVPSRIGQDQTVSS